MPGFNRGGPRNFGGPREEFDATCSECKKACKVPFRPVEGRDVFCRECYAKRKGL